MQAESREDVEIVGFEASPMKLDIGENVPALRKTAGTLRRSRPLGAKPLCPVNPSDVSALMASNFCRSMAAISGA